MLNRDYRLLRAGSSNRHDLSLSGIKYKNSPIVLTPNMPMGPHKQGEHSGEACFGVRAAGCIASVRKVLKLFVLRGEALLRKWLMSCQKSTIKTARAVSPVLNLPQKKVDSADKPTTGSTTISVCVSDHVSYFRHYSSLTSNPKVHHPAIDSLVLSLRCGNATAIFVSSRHRDFVAEVRKCGFRSLDLFVLVLWLHIFFTAPPSMSGTRTYEYLIKSPTMQFSYSTCIQP